MKTFPISSLITNNSQIKCGKFSKYAQQYLKSDVNGFLHNLNNFFENITQDKFAQNMKALNNIGIKQIGKNITEGLIVDTKELNYHVCIPMGNTIQLNMLNGDNKVFKTILFNYNCDSYKYTWNTAGSDFEDFIGDSISNIDRIIITAIKEMTPKAPKPFIPDKSTSQKIEELNNTLAIVLKNAAIKDFGYINEDTEYLIQAIKEQYRNIKDLFKRVPNNTSRFNVRSYYNNYIPEESANNRITFKDAGPSGEKISFAEISYKNKPYFDFSYTDIKGNKQKFVFSEEGTVQKNLPFRSFLNDYGYKRINSIPDYYTQQEIDNSNLCLHLNCLSRELRAFTKHAENWLGELEEFKQMHSNNDIASTDSYNEIINDISSQFKQYMTRIRKVIPKKEERDNFKTENGISKERLTTSVTFLNLAPNKSNSLRLSFPTIPNNTATQILEMNGDDVVKSFYILDNKLLKIKFKTRYDRFIHYNRNMYFYDNEYMKNSKLDLYLKIIQDKLHELNEKLDAINTQNKGISV